MRSRPSLALFALFPLTVCTMLPVTAVVPVLRGLVQERYGAGDLTTSLFMSVNMVGALLAAPALGWLSDRYGWTKGILIVAAGTDALLWWVFTLPLPLWGLMSLRLVEGAAHIGALSMLMTVMSRASVDKARRARMAAMGGAVIFGVAVGAPLGGILGREDVLLPLRLGAAVMVAVAILSALVVPRNVSRPDPEALPKWPTLHAPPALRLPYLFGFVDRLTIGIFIIAFSMLTADMGYGTARTGLLIGAFMLTFTLLTYPAGKLAARLGLWRLVFTGSFGFGLAYACIPWVEGGAMWALMVVCGALSAVMFGPNLMLIVRGSTEETRASAMGGFNAAGSLGFLVGPMLAGGALELLKSRASDEFAYRAVFAGAGLLEVICVAAAAWLLGRRRSSPG